MCLCNKYSIFERHNVKISVPYVRGKKGGREGKRKGKRKEGKEGRRKKGRILERRGRDIRTSSAFILQGDTWRDSLVWEMYLVLHLKSPF